MKRLDPDQKNVRRRISATIEQRRVTSGIGVEKLALAAQVDLSQMVKVLRGDAGLSVYAIKRVADALGWTLGELMIAAFPPAAARRKSTATA